MVKSHSTSRKALYAPIAQWIERCPPEAEARVRVAVGVQEPPEADLERFLSMIRFDTRQKLESLPDFQLKSQLFFFAKKTL